MSGNKPSSGTIKITNGLVATESTIKFYIKEEQPLTASTAKMLTEKNIHITEFRQSDDAGEVMFATYPVYWTDENDNLLPQYREGYPAYVYNESSNIYQYVNAYETYLKESGVSSARAALISYGQLESLGCDFSEYTCGPEESRGGPLENPAPVWVYSTDYWVGFSRGNSGLLDVSHYWLYLRG